MKMIRFIFGVLCLAVAIINFIVMETQMNMGVLETFLLLLMTAGPLGGGLILAYDASTEK